MSNGKDQTARLFDIRRMLSKKENRKHIGYGTTGYDYRWMVRNAAVAL